MRPLGLGLLAVVLALCAPGTDARADEHASASSPHTAAPAGSAHAAHGSSSGSGHPSPGPFGRRGGYGRGYGYGYGYGGPGVFYPASYACIGCGWGFGYYPSFGAAPVVLVEPEVAPRPYSASAALGMQFNAEGAAVDGMAGVEGARWGLAGSLTGVYLPAADGPDAVDAIELFDLHLSYAFLVRPQGRLRAEVGLAGVVSPDLSALGPDAGLSGAMGLVGPFGLEASTRLMAWPYRRLDMTAAGTLTLGPFGFKFGYKHLWLDDAGLAGTRTVRRFSGPYLGMGFLL